MNIQYEILMLIMLALICINVWVAKCYGKLDSILIEIKNRNNEGLK